MSNSNANLPILIEDLRSSQLALLKCCQQYQKKETAGTLTSHEYNSWCECLDEHKKVSAEIKRIQEEEASWTVVEEPWVLVEQDEAKN